MDDIDLNLQFEETIKEIEKENLFNLLDLLANKLGAIKLIMEKRIPNIDNENMDILEGRKRELEYLIKLIGKKYDAYKKL